MCSDAEAVNLVALLVEADDGVFVDIVAGDDLKLVEPVQLEVLPDL